MLRDQLFTGIGHLGTRRPWTVLAVVGVLVLVFAALIPGIGVSTSRTGLVDEDEPQQARMNAFFERYGRPDNPVFVVSGGTIDERRRAVDALESALESEPQLRGRVLGRLHPRDIASIALLQEPGALAQIRASMPPGTSLVRVLEGGLPAWLKLIEAQVQGGLDNPPEIGGPEAMQKAAEGLEQLAMMAALFETMLRGDDPMESLADAMPEGQKGIDDAGYLTTVDQQYNLVTLFPQIDSDEGTELAPLIHQLRAIRDRALDGQPASISADLTGLPSLAVDELRLVTVGLQRSSIATTVGIFVLCLLLFRSLRQTIVALVPLLPGVVLTLSFVHLLYGHLNLITSNFVAVLLGLGIDFSVHFIARRNEEVRGGAQESEALSESLRTTGPGIMTGAIITAAAFLTSATTEFTAYAELGIVTALGLMVIMLATFFLIPPLMVVGRGDARAKASPEPPGFFLVPRVVSAARIPLVVLATAAAIAGAFGLPSIDFDSNYFKFLPEETESAQGLSRLEYDPLASPVFAAFQAESIESARAKASQLRALDSVAGVQSPSDLLPPLDQTGEQGVDGLTQLRAGFEGLDRDPDFDALAKVDASPEALAPVVQNIADLLDDTRYALKQVGGPAADAAERAHEAFSSLHKTLESLDRASSARLEALHADVAAILEPAWGTAKAVAQRGHYAPTDLPPLFSRRFVSLDGTAVAVYAVPDGQFWEREVAERFAAQVREVDSEASGLAMIHVAHNQMVYNGFKRAAGLAAVVILVLLVIDFRSLGDALLALLPTGLGWLWMIGTMAVFGLTFNIANIVAMPLVLGIGMAFGVHLMHRVREQPADAHSDDKALLEDVVRGTGGAIMVAALTTMVGFGGLMLGGYGAMVSLGILMVLGIGCCLVATVFVLPAALLLLGQVETKVKRTRRA